MSDVLNKFITGISNCFTGVSIKTREITDITMLKMEISDLRKEREDTLTDIGKEVYKMQLKSEFDHVKIKEMCETVTKMREKIKAKREKIDEVYEKANESYRKAQKKKRNADNNDSEDE